jgi:hypothetical protein
MTKTGDLGLCSVLGFSGDVVDGLICHPDGVHVIYPLGSTVIVRRRDDPSDQKFLRGHTDKVRYHRQTMEALGLQEDVGGTTEGE